MECNKDDAVRAKEIAETKMKNNDFEGAKRLALKAQNLYPELENINQILSICNVHCSAQRTMVGSEKDWYGILQAEKFADVVAVKKQYKRLALFLHPDKNRFPGAEAAFKLICEANAVLSDPAKKSVYDNRVRVIVRSAAVVPPPHHMNKNSQFSQQYGGHVKVSNAFNTLNQHHAKQTSFPVKQDTFWTVCPFCSFKYQCGRNFVGSNMCCQKCTKTFTCHEIGAQDVPLVSKQAPVSAQGVPVKPTVSQSYGFQEKGVHTQGTFKVGVQNGQGVSASHAGFQWSARRQTAQPNVQTESIFKGKQEGQAEKVSEGGKVGRTSNGHANNRKKGNLKNKRKRGGKFVVESSESYDTTSESDSDDVTIGEKFDSATNLNSGPGQVHASRRSSRNRHNVSYNEVDDDDKVLLSSLKRSRGSKLSEDKENDTSDGESRKHDVPTNADRSKSESKETRGKEAGGMTDIGADAIEIESDSEEKTAEYEESEFYDFEKDRDVSCFAVNQFWACYDSLDGMPRYYAKIKKVCTSPFELSIQWLEVDPADNEQKKWFDEDLPIGCGSFKLGETEPTSRNMFSQQVDFLKGKKRGSLIIQPKAGEVWALFNDWDLSWSTEPENHRVYKYEVVEVLSNFDADAGSRVCHLAKVKGFVSLFQRSALSKIDSFMIRPNEVYRFSHRIPYFKMTGKEREGVPIGSFELDPASLPVNHDDLYSPEIKDGN
ncbi:hypothetical protein ACS0TY_021426 [Phlomoides rotata]